MDGLIHQGLLGFSLCAAITTKDFVGGWGGMMPSFIQPVFIECLLCARHHSRYRDTEVDKTQSQP